jgi:hypothetical protein
MKISYNIIIIFVILILLFEIIKCSKPYKKRIEKFYVNDGEQLGRDDMPIMHGSEISTDLDYLPCIKELNINRIDSKDNNCIGVYQSKYDVSNVVGDCDSESKHIIRDYPNCRSINYEIGSHSGIGSQSRNETTFITLPDTKLTHYKSFTYDASRYDDTGVHNESIEEEPLYEITPTMINNRYGSNTIEKNNAGSSCNLDIDSSCNYNGKNSQYSLECLKDYYDEQSKTFSSDSHEQLIILNTILKIFLEAESNDCLIGNGEDKEFIGVLKEDTGVGVKFFAIIIDNDSEIKIEHNQTDFRNFVLYRKEDINAREKWESCQYDNLTESSIRKKIMKIGGYAINNKGSTANIPISLLGSQTCAVWQGSGACDYVDFGMDNSDSDLEINVRKWIGSNGRCGSSTEEVLINCPNDTNTSFKTDGCDNSHLDYNLAYSIICDGNTNIQASHYVKFIVEDVTDYYNDSIKSQFIIKVDDSSNCYLLNSRQILSTIFEEFTYDNYMTMTTSSSDKYICNKFGFSSEDIQNKKNRGIYGSSDFDDDPYIDESDTTQNLGLNIGSNVQTDAYLDNVLYCGKDKNVEYNTIKSPTEPNENNINTYVISSNISLNGYTTTRRTKRFILLPKSQTDKIVNMYRIWGDFINTSNNPKSWTLTGVNRQYTANGRQTGNVLLDTRTNITNWMSKTDALRDVGVSLDNNTGDYYYTQICGIKLKSSANINFDNDIKNHKICKTFRFDNNLEFDEYILDINESNSSSNLSIMEFKMYYRHTFDDNYPYRFSMNDLVKLKNNKNYSFGNENDKFKSFTNIFRNNIYYNIELDDSLINININSIIIEEGNLKTTYANLSTQSAVPVLTNYGSSNTTDTNCVKTYLSPDLNKFQGEDAYNIQFQLYGTNKCIDVGTNDNKRTIMDGDIKIHDCHDINSDDAKYQLFKFADNHTIVSKYGRNKRTFEQNPGVLNVWGGNPNKEEDIKTGDKIKLAGDGHGKLVQRFTYEPDKLRIKMKDTTGKWCFNLKDGKVENNNRIIIHPCNDHRDQRWKVIHKDYGNFDAANAAKYKSKVMNEN